MASEDVGQAYDLFQEKCNKIINSKYIMSDNNFIGLFRCIAGTPCLFDFLGKCTQGFNYEMEFEKACKGRAFKLPENNRKIIALVSGMLFNINQNKLNFNAFLLKYFFEEDIEDSYIRFCKVIMTPYSIAFGDILKGDIASETHEAEDFEVTIGDVIKEQIVPYISTIREIVDGDSSINKTDRSNFLIMLDGLNYAFEMSSSKIIEVVWVGLKSVFKDYRPARSYIKSIDKLLVVYAVIH